MDFQVEPRMHSNLYSWPFLIMWMHMSNCFISTFCTTCCSLTMSLTVRITTSVWSMNTDLEPFPGSMKNKICCSHFDIMRKSPGCSRQCEKIMLQWYCRPFPLRHPNLQQPFPNDATSMNWHIVIHEDEIRHV